MMGHATNYISTRSGPQQNVLVLALILELEIVMKMSTTMDFSGATE